MVLNVDLYGVKNLAIGANALSEWYKNTILNLGT